MGTPIPLVSINELFEALKLTNFLSPADARRRAELLHADLCLLNMPDFQILRMEGVPHHSGKRVPLIQYSFGRVNFGLDKVAGPDNVKRQVGEMEGTGLDSEELLYLSQISEIGHRCVPQLWLSDRDLRHNLEDPGMHLSTLNEVWWLARWRGLDALSVEREAKLSPQHLKSIDWRFKALNIWTINLEVKRLVRSFADFSYHKNHNFYTALRSDTGAPDPEDPRLKFRRSGPDEINVLAVTWFDEISPELEQKVQTFLDTDDRVDAVIFWSIVDRRRGSWFRAFPKFRDIGLKKHALADILIEPDEEDHSRVMMLKFPRTREEVIREAREARLSDTE